MASSLKSQPKSSSNNSLASLHTISQSFQHIYTSALYVQLQWPRISYWYSHNSQQCPTKVFTAQLQTYIQLSVFSVLLTFSIFQESSWPNFQRACYLLNKLVFNRLNSVNLFFAYWWRFQDILWDMSGWLTKLECLVFYFFKIFKSLAFDSLGELFSSSLATEKPSFWQLTIWTQDCVNHWKLVDFVFNEILEREILVA